MRIIALGKQALPNWVGRRVECCECGCVFELEVSDVRPSKLFGMDIHEMNCPVCNVVLFFMEKDISSLIKAKRKP